MTQKVGCAIIEKSIFMNIGESDGGIDTMPAGIFVMPRGMPASVTATMPMRMPPVTRRVSSVTMSNSPARASRPPALLRSGERPTRTAGLATTSPALWRPIKVMKMPMPADTPIFSVLGIELTTSSRTFVQVSRIKMTPSIKIAARATCQGIFIPSTTVKAKKALSPMPGARAKG